MQKVFLALLCTCLAATAFAQQRADTAILLAMPADAPRVARLKQKLVELALQTPDMRQYKIKKEINQYEVNKAGSKWLDHFNVNGNLNEFTIDQRKGDNINNFYPRYNFGVSVPLGSFIGIPNDVKHARANGRLLDVQRESEAAVIKTKVLQAYEDYAANKQLVELQVPLIEDALNHHKRIEERFTKGEPDVTVETLNEAYRAYNTEMVKKVTLERELRQSKIALESLIGMTLEEVLQQLN
jgi:outer membrane protein TolC